MAGMGMVPAAFAPIDVPILRRIAPTPPASAMAVLEITETDVQLTLPEVGTIAASAAGLTLSAVDDTMCESLLWRGGTWGRGQVLLRNGYVVIPGTALERDGHGLIITGVPRAGTTALALALTRRGWRILADGVVPVDRSGRVHSLASPVVLDTRPAAALFAEFTQVAVPAGRPRVRIEAPRSTQVTDVATVVDLVVARQLTRSIIDLVDDVDRWSDICASLPPLIPGSPRPVTLAMPRWVRLTRPASRDLEVVAPNLPDQLAERLEELWTAW